MDGYRHLDLKIEQIDVNEAELGIDAATAKTVINLEIAFTFSQEWQDDTKKKREDGEFQSPTKGWRGMSPPSPGLHKVKETIVYRKTHKQLKELSRELGMDMKKIKYLDRESQISHVYAQLCKIFTKENHERNCVIDFLVHDYLLSDGMGGFIDKSSPAVTVDKSNPLKHSSTAVGAGLMATQTGRPFGGEDDDLFRMDSPNPPEMPFA